MAMFLRLVNAKKARVRSGYIKNYLILLAWAVCMRVFIRVYI